MKKILAMLIVVVMVLATIPTATALGIIICESCDYAFGVLMPRPIIRCPHCMHTTEMPSPCVCVDDCDSHDAISCTCILCRESGVPCFGCVKCHGGNFAVLPPTNHAITLTLENGVIHLHNPTDTAVSTKGLYLTNDDDLARWQMPAVIVRAGQTIQVRMNSDSVTPVLKRMTANFDLQNQDILRLSDVYGNVLSEVVVDNSMLPTTIDFYERVISVGNTSIPEMFSGGARIMIESVEEFNDMIDTLCYGELAGLYDEAFFAERYIAAQVFVNSNRRTTEVRSDGTLVRSGVLECMGIPRPGVIHVELFLLELPRSFRPDTFRIEGFNTHSFFCGDTTWCRDCIAATADVDYFVADYSRVTLDRTLSNAGSNAGTARIANSYTELQAIIADVEREESWGINLIPSGIEPADIDFDYFAAVVIHFVGGSGGTRTIVESLTILGDNLTVKTSRAMGCMPTPDMAAWRIILLIERSEMEGVTKARTVRTASEIGDCNVVSCDGNCWARVDDWFNSWGDTFIS